MFHLKTVILTVANSHHIAKTFNHIVYVAELLNQSKDHIAKLENQCKQLEKQGQTYPDLLEKMRQKMDAEVEAYKRDCEDTHRKNVSRDTSSIGKMA